MGIPAAAVPAPNQLDGFDVIRTGAERYGSTMPIVPDTKDWTWVLTDLCPECGFDAAAVDVAAMGDLIRANAAAWPSLVCHERSGQRTRDDRWSALEYGCHVRDVYRIFDERLQLMLDQDAPAFANWDQDATATADEYSRQVPARVATDLLVAAASLADRFELVTGSDWQRTGFRSDGAAFTVDSFARYLLHDPVHHLHDVASGYASLRTSTGTGTDIEE